MSETAKNLYRRSGLDRRGWQPMPQLPFIDSDGKTVTQDRRKTPDRRSDTQEDGRKRK